MTLLARDEADVIDAQVAYHLHAGVDYVIAMDNASTDDTAEILARYERAGYLRLIRQRGDDMRQDEWVTHLARLAATEHDADWVINSDADEFWWPRGGTLKEVLAAVPDRYGVVRGCWRHFLPRPEDGAFFAERMTVRLATPAHPGAKETIYHAHQKVAHRARRDVEVERGNHNADGVGLEPLRAWYPIEVLHFSFRSVEQLERKARGGLLRDPASVPRHRRDLVRAAGDGRLQQLYERFSVDDAALARGRAEGTLAVDTRLRDALRSLRSGDGTFRPGASRTLSFPRPSAVDDAAYAAETSALAEIDGIVRAHDRTDALQRRLDALERSGIRVARRLARG